MAANLILRDDVDVPRSQQPDTDLAVWPGVL